MSKSKIGKNPQNSQYFINLKGIRSKKRYFHKKHQILDKVPPKPTFIDFFSLDHKKILFT